MKRVIGILLFLVSFQSFGQETEYSRQLFAVDISKRQSIVILTPYKDKLITLPSLSTDQFWLHSITYSAYDNYRLNLKGNEGLNPRGGNIQTALIFFANRAQGKPMSQDIFYPY